MRHHNTRDRTGHSRSSGAIADRRQRCICSSQVPPSELEAQRSLARAHFLPRTSTSGYRGTETTTMWWGKGPDKIPKEGSDATREAPKTSPKEIPEQRKEF